MKSADEENDRIDRCIKDALKLTEGISASDYRIEAFKIILSHLLEARLIERDQVRQTNLKVETVVKKGDEGIERGALPTIMPGDSTRTNIVLLLETEWGEVPRSSKEISKALDYNGVGDPKNVSTRLKDLFEDRIILRRNQDDSVVYWKNPNPPIDK